MKQIIFTLGLALTLSACGKTTFSGTADSVTAKSGVEDPNAASAGNQDPAVNNNQNQEGIPLEQVEVTPDIAKNYACAPGKIYICHVPPGNPAEAHTLCIGKSAVAAHLGHSREDDEGGDLLGSCDDAPNRHSCERRRQSTQ